MDPGRMPYKTIVKAVTEEQRLRQSTASPTQPTSTTQNLQNLDEMPLSEVFAAVLRRGHDPKYTGLIGGEAASVFTKDMAHRAAGDDFRGRLAGRAVVKRAGGCHFVNLVEPQCKP